MQSSIQEIPNSGSVNLKKQLEQLQGVNLIASEREELAEDFIFKIAINAARLGRSVIILGCKFYSKDVINIMVDNDDNYTPKNFSDTLPQYYQNIQFSDSYDLTNEEFVKDLAKNDLIVYMGDIRERNRIQKLYNLQKTATPTLVLSRINDKTIGYSKCNKPREQDILEHSQVQYLSNSIIALWQPCVLGFTAIESSCLNMPSAGENKAYDTFGKTFVCFLKNREANLRDFLLV